MVTRLLTVSVAACLASCAAGGPTAPPGAPGGPGGAAAPPERPGAPVPRQIRPGAAASALVAQAHRQAASGAYPQAAATLERALRIEPDDPLLWVELGRVQLAQNNAGQADSMGRKALALAVADPGAQAAAWRLIADSLRARGRNGEAAEADQRAASLAPR